ncbi:MAG: rhomboid family intramembrane serine protease [Algisphaera sp.]
MFFPLYTDQRLRTTPWVTYGVVVLNVVVYALTWRDLAAYSTGGLGLPQALEQYPAVGYYLWPGDALSWLPQFVTYMFLHSPPQPAPIIGIQLPLHLLVNMVFLMVFGHAVEERLGRGGYLAFYLAAGVVAGIGHCLTSNAPVLGASGAVAGVVGAYLALFPRSDVTMGYWLIVMFGTFQISSVLLILFQVMTDVFFQLSGFGGNTAYTAHLVGYLFGFGVPMALLAFRVLPREPADMYTLLAHRRRRQQFSKQARSGKSAWASEATSVAGGAAFVSGDSEVAKQRARIADAIQASRPADAAVIYEQLMVSHPGQVLSQDVQLEVANQLMQAQRFVPASQAYELFLTHHRDYGQRSSVELVLGLIYARYAPNPQRAVELLTSAMKHLNASDRALAQSTLKELDIKPS